MKRMEGVFRHKSICITLIIGIMAQMFSFSAIGYANEGITVLAAVDSLYREIYVYGSIPTGAEKDVAVYIKGPSSTPGVDKDILLRQCKSYLGGAYALKYILPADAVTGVYTVTVGADGFSAVTKTFSYQQVTNPIKITGTVYDNIVLMKSATEIDTDKNTMAVKVSNGTVRSGTLVQDVDYEIGYYNTNGVFVNSLPTGLTVKATGNSTNNTIEFSLNGKMTTTTVTQDLELGVIVKVPAVQNAQTRSEEIRGITLMEYNKAGKINAFVDSSNPNVSMIRPLQVDPKNNTFAIKLKYNRKPKTMLLETDFTVTDLPKGMVLSATGDSTGSKIIFTTSPYNPTEAITSNKTIKIILKKSAVTGALADSSEVSVEIIGIAEGGTSGGGGGSSVSIPVTSTPTPAPSVGPTAAPSTTPAPTTAPSPTPGFSDINSHWAKSDIVWMATNKYANGMPDGTFKPDDQITRAQFVKLVVSILKLELPDYNNAYTDVNASDWYASYVQAAANIGIIGSVGGNFRPNDNLTREEMSKMIVQAYGTKKTEPVENANIDLFDDKDQISGWALDSVQKAVKLGVMNGMTPTEFGPKSNATRAQAVVILRRLINAVK